MWMHRFGLPDITQCRALCAIAMAPKSSSPHAFLRLHYGSCWVQTGVKPVPKREVTYTGAQLADSTHTLDKQAADGSCEFMHSPSRLGPDLKRAFNCEILLPTLFLVWRDGRSPRSRK